MFDNVQFWIWLIVIVITLISKANKKKSQQSERNKPDFGGTNKPVSFEDLLREIQASKAPAKQVVQPQPKTVEYVDYDDDIEEEIKPFKNPDDRTEDEIYATYEKAKTEAFNRASLEETMHIEDTVVNYEKFKGYKRERKVASAANYIKELRNPSSFKKAFILSEILTKRF